MRELHDAVAGEVAKVVVGQRETVATLLAAAALGGHVLLEGPPGVAKTLLANAVARALGVDFRRVQFTPDMLPSDLTGNVTLRGGELTFRRFKGEGPLPVHHIHDPVVDCRRRQLTLVIHQAGAPHRHQAFDVGFRDCLERTVALAVKTHALGRDVFRVLAVVDGQLFIGLGQSQPRHHGQQGRQQPGLLHAHPPVVRP